MVEGPLVYRVAQIHRSVLLAKAFAANSPNGRFAEGARAIDGRYVSRIESHGKNIFYFFTREKEEHEPALAELPTDVVVVRIHFGMSGSFRAFRFPGPGPRETTRLRLTNEGEKLEFHLSAAVCEHDDMEIYTKTIKRLGPDPLRPDADKEITWRKIQMSRRKIGSVLMDQSMIAGIGNIYRAEILFAVGVHPDQPASSLPRRTFEDLWNHAERLFRVGLMTGSTITVSTTDAGKPYSEMGYGERFYVYGRSNCKRCKGAVQSWPCSGRTVYACPNCQLLSESGEEGLNGAASADHILEGRRKGAAQRNPSGSESDASPRSSNKNSKSYGQEIKKRSTVGARKGGVVEHNPLKGLASETEVVDFSRSLTHGTKPGSAPTAPGKDGPKIKQGRGRALYHSHAFPTNQPVRDNVIWRPKLLLEVSNRRFRTRVINCSAAHKLGTLIPPRAAAVGLRALGVVLCGGLASPLTMSYRSPPNLARSFFPG